MDNVSGIGINILRSFQIGRDAASLLVVLVLCGQVAIVQLHHRLTVFLCHLNNLFFTSFYFLLTSCTINNGGSIFSESA